MTLIKQSGSALTGMIGGIVLVNFNGGTYMRRAPQRQKKDSWTPQQLLHRQRFSMVNKFCGQFKSSLIPQIWNAATFSKVQNFGKVQITNMMSGYALFLKSNMPAFAPDGSVADVKKLRLSTGSLTLPQGIEAHRSAVGTSTIQVSWDYDGHIGGKNLKQELMLISAGDGLYSEITATGILKGYLNGSFELPELPKAATHIYLFFTSQDRRDYSESVCFEI